MPRTPVWGKPSSTILNFLTVFIFIDLKKLFTIISITP
jgi:hypothetical protein